MGGARQWFIYTLSDPRTGEVRYVGKTFNPTHRLAVHVAYGGRKHTRSSRWIGGLRKLGARPVMAIVESGQGDAHEAAERSWIAALRALGVRLTNHEPGGRGSGSMSAETKAKIGAAHRGVPRPESVKEKCRINNLGKKRSAETREKIRRAKTGLKHSESTRRKMSDAHLGHTVSAETRELIAASKRGKPRSPETIAKISAARMGKPLPQELRARLSAIHKARWAAKKASST